MSLSPSRLEEAKRDIDVDTGEIKYLAQKARMWFDIFSKDPQWSEDYEECLNVVQYYWNDEKAKNEMFETIRNRIISGMTPNDASFRNEFIWQTRVQWSKKLTYMGELTQLAPMNPYNRALTSADSFIDRSEHFFLKNLKPFGYMTFTGDPGTGKTDTACSFMELCLRDPEFRVATNIWMKDGQYPENVQRVTKLSEAIVTCIDNQLRHGAITNLILDELPQVFNRKRATSGKYVNMEKMLLLLRKAGGNFLGIIQRPEDVPSVVESFSHVSIFKVEKDKMIFKRNRETYVIKHVPGTKLPFDTKDMASFIMDIDMDELHEYVSNLDKQTNQLLAIRDYLDARGKNTVTQGMINTAIRVLRDHRAFEWEDVGRIMGMHPSTAHRRYHGKIKAGNL